MKYGIFLCQKTKIQYANLSFDFKKIKEFMQMTL
jgi:hypothetical protein